MGISRIFGLCAAFLFASSVGAATIDVGPSDYRNFGPNGSHTGSGIKSTFGQQVRLPPTISGPTRILPVSRNAVVPYTSAAARMRPFLSVHPMSVAASAAITGMFLAMEWYFDEDLGEWAVREVENIPPIEGQGWESPLAPGYYSSPNDACMAVIANHSPGSQLSDYTVRSASYGLTGTCYLQNPTLNAPITWVDPQCPSGSVLNEEEGACQQYVGTPVIEGEFTRLAGELPSMPAEQVAEGTGDAMRRHGVAPGFHDTPMTGPSSVSGPDTTSTTTDPVTGDTTITTTSTTTNISYDSESITTSDTTITTTYQNGQETSTTETTETPGELPVESGGGGGGGGGVWPEFCTWASVVCDWLNWTQEEPPPEQDLPAVIDDDFYQEKTISFGSKSCPPDHVINLAPFMPTPVAVSFQPLCDFAGLIYYMVMAASYIIAAYITIGVARNV